MDGLGEVIPVSAESRRDLDLLKEAVAALLPEAEAAAEEEVLPRIAIVGRRNAGKSTFVNALVRPVMVILTIPITFLTFGLFLLVVNALMLWLVATIVPGVKVKGFVPALLGSIVLSVLNFLVALVFGVTPNGG